MDFKSHNNLPSSTALIAFEATARFLSFSKAASSLHVTQAAISHQVKILEDFFNVKLFIRDKKQIKLTEAAHLLLPEVSNALESLSRGSKKVLDLCINRHVISITTIHNFASNWLVPNLKDFYDRFPEYVIKIDCTEKLLDLGVTGHDLAIRYGTGKWSGVTSKKLISEQLIPVCSPSLIAGKVIKDEQDLLNLPWIKIENSVTWDLWLKSRNIDNPISPPKLIVDDALLATDAVIAGLGVGIGRKLTIKRFIESGQLVEPLQMPTKGHYSYYLTFERSAIETQKVADFVGWIEDTLVN